MTLLVAVPAVSMARWCPSLVVAVKDVHETTPVMPFTVTVQDTGAFASVAVLPDTLNL
jgi:hypothetical protein